MFSTHITVHTFYNSFSTVYESVRIDLDEIINPKALLHGERCEFGLRYLRGLYSFKLLKLNYLCKEDGLITAREFRRLLKKFGDAVKKIQCPAL